MLSLKGQCMFTTILCHCRAEIGQYILDNNTLAQILAAYLICGWLVDGEAAGINGFVVFSRRFKSGCRDKE